MFDDLSRGSSCPFLFLFQLTSPPPDSPSTYFALLPPDSPTCASLPLPSTPPPPLPGPTFSASAAAAAANPPLAHAPSILIDDALPSAHPPPPPPPTPRSHTRPLFSSTACTETRHPHPPSPHPNAPAAKTTPPQNSPRNFCRFVGRSLHCHRLRRAAKGSTATANINVLYSQWEFTAIVPPRSPHRSHTLFVLQDAHLQPRHPCPPKS